MEKIGKGDLNVIRSLTKVLLYNEVYFQELMAKQDSVAAKIVLQLRKFCLRRLSL